MLVYSQRFCILTPLLCKISQTNEYEWIFFFLVCVRRFNMCAYGGIYFTFLSSPGKLLSPCCSGSHRWAPGSARGRCGPRAPSHGPPRRNRSEVPSETAPPLSLLSPSLWLPSCWHFFLLLLRLLLFMRRDSSLQLHKRQDTVKLETFT